jgi:phosphohistidine phosphatase SixA
MKAPAIRSMPHGHFVPGPGRPLVSAALGILGAAILVAAVQGQTLSQRELPAALRQGGYVLVIRHATAPRDVPDSKTANADNVTPERQLDEAGRRNATAMGEAIRSLKIPIGEVFTSPTYRARETVKFAQFSNASPVEELGDGGQSMGGITEAQGAWLRARTTRSPGRGNLVMVTHLQNFTRAFPEWGASVSEGEAAIFRPDGSGGTALVARVKIEQWPELR